MTTKLVNIALEYKRPGSCKFSGKTDFFVIGFDIKAYKF